MKDWSEYVSQIEYVSRHEIRRELRRNLDNESLTAAERSARELALPSLVTAEHDKRNEARRADEKRLFAEFWKDVRDELGYADILEEAACQALEKMAWDDGHSGGLNDVYIAADRLCDFAKEVVKGTKKASKQCE